MNNENEIADLAANVKDMTAFLVQFIAANKRQQQSSVPNKKLGLVRAASSPVGLILRQGLVRAENAGREKKKGNLRTMGRETRTMTKRVKHQFMAQQLHHHQQMIINFKITTRGQN